MTNSIYCTYLTIYSGNKLPPFYIGSTSVDNINKGYRGSVSSKKYKEIWKLELRNNPQLFETKILTSHNTRKQAILQEEKFHRCLNVVKNCLYINLSICNGKPIGGPCANETREKLSRAQMGRKHNHETKQKIKLANIERFKDPKEREKLSKSHIGRKQSEETKQKIRISNTGKKRSQETLSKMSIASKNMSQDHRKKISIAIKGKRHSEETKKKMSESKKGNLNFKGKRHSEETKKKMSESRKGNQNAKKNF